MLKKCHFIYITCVVLLTTANPSLATNEIKIVNVIGDICYTENYAQLEENSCDNLPLIKPGDSLPLRGFLYTPGMSLLEAQCPSDIDFEEGYHNSANRRIRGDICDSRDGTLGRSDRIRIGGIEANIPYIVSPRYTLVSTPVPNISWNAVKDALFYKIWLVREKNVVESESIFIARVYASTDKLVESMPFPKDGPLLKRGENYNVLVQACFQDLEFCTASTSTLSSQETLDLNDYDVVSRKVSGIRFRILSDASTKKRLIPKSSIFQEIEDKEEKIWNMSLFYETLNLYSEAIQELGILIDFNSQKKPFYYKKRGDLYAQSGLLLLAQKDYDMALESAQIISNIRWRKAHVSEINMKLDLIHDISETELPRISN